MTEREFQTNVQGAEALLNLSEGTDTKFWSGYLRGLRRTHYGSKFGTEEEHARLTAAAESFYESKRMRGCGYRAGFEGQDVKAAMLALAGPKTYTCLRCNHPWRPQGGKPPRNCPECKSSYWNTRYRNAVNNTNKTGHENAYEIERYGIIDAPGWFEDKAMVYSTHKTLCAAKESMREGRFIDEHGKRRNQLCIVLTAERKGASIPRDMFPPIITVGA
jgi:hypothetical protein